MKDGYMVVRSIRFNKEMLDKAQDLGYDINLLCRGAVAEAILDDEYSKSLETNQKALVLLAELKQEIQKVINE